MGKGSRQSSSQKVENFTVLVHFLLQQLQFGHFEPSIYDQNSHRWLIMHGFEGIYNPPFFAFSVPEPVLLLPKIDNPPANAVEIEPVNDSDDELKQQVAGELREVRMRSRWESSHKGELPPYPKPDGASTRLESMQKPTSPPAPVSPDRCDVNRLWDVSAALQTAPSGRLARLFSPLRKPLQRMTRFLLGSFVEQQAEMNSAQVKFDNQLVEYIDERLDRISAHYDHLLGLHGKRMEEIDERHLILQQELIQHVHDLIKRIDFVFETAEQNHLYLEGFLREVRDETQALATRLEHLSPSGEENR